MAAAIAHQATISVCGNLKFDYWNNKCGLFDQIPNGKFFRKHIDYLENDLEMYLNQQQ